MGKSGESTATELTLSDGEHESSALLFSYFNEIGIISQLAGNEFERCLPAGLTNSQFNVLNWFCRVDQEASPGRLARAFQVTAGAMTNTLKKLAAKGFVKIEPDAISGRQKRVTMTTAGKAMRNQAIAATAPLFRDISEAIPAERLDKQVKELQKVRRYLDERRYQNR